MTWVIFFFKQNQLCVQDGLAPSDQDARLAEVDMLQMGVQQLITAYNTTVMHCANQTVLASHA